VASSDAGDGGWEATPGVEGRDEENAEKADEEREDDMDRDGEGEGETPCVESGDSRAARSSGTTGLRARFSGPASFTVGTGMGASGGMSSNKMRRVA
jgi:hypothetical protein